jgi:hypothetical protein
MVFGIVLSKQSIFRLFQWSIGSGWCRFLDHSGSQTWKHLQNSLNILLQWIAWYPGSGTLIVIGRDSILGMGESTLLSEDLILALNQRGIHFLFQAQGVPRPGSIGDYWVTSEDLDLQGALAQEWQCLEEKSSAMA